MGILTAITTKTTEQLHRSPTSDMVQVKVTTRVMIDSRSSFVPPK